jgi:hypothetical protein
MDINVAGDILFERTKIDIAGRRLRLALVFPCCLYRPDRARGRPMPQERRGLVLCLTVGRQGEEADIGMAMRRPFVGRTDARDHDGRSWRS